MAMRLKCLPLHELRVEKNKLPRQTGAHAAENFKGFGGLKATNDAGFMTRPAWTLMDELDPFKTCPRMDLTIAKSLAQRLINIPSSSHLVLVAS